MPDPRRGELWLIDLGDPIGHEAGDSRPALVVSDDRANVYGLAVVCPITSNRRNYPTHVEVEPGESGLAMTSYIQAEQVRTISGHRLTHRLGTADSPVMAQVERALRFLLRL